jgi:hypothetical protein
MKQKEHKQRMSKSYRKEVLKRLNQELDATTDTKEIIRIGNTIAKLTKPKNRVGRPSTKKAAAPSNNNSSILNRVTWSAVDQLSPKDKLCHFVIVQWEKERRKLGRKLTEAEQKAIWESFIASLSDEDRAALDEASEND